MAYVKRYKVRLIIKHLREGAFLIDAIKSAGFKSHETLRLWRTRERDFSKYWHQRLDFLVKRTMGSAADFRVEKVERAFESKLLSQQASAACYIFYLCNKAPDRWRHVPSIINNNNVQMQQSQEMQVMQRIEEARFIEHLGDDEVEQLLERVLSKR